MNTSTTSPTNGSNITPPVRQRRQLQAVEQYAQPFTDKVTAAENELTKAEECRASLADQLATANRRDRRVLEPAIAIAEHDIKTATVHRDEAVTDAKPAKTLTAQAKTGLRDLRDEQSRQQMYGNGATTRKPSASSKSASTPSTPGGDGPTATNSHRTKSER